MKKINIFITILILSPILAFNQQSDNKEFLNYLNIDTIVSLKGTGELRKNAGKNLQSCIYENDYYILKVEEFGKIDTLNLWKINLINFEQHKLKCVIGKKLKNKKDLREKPANFQVIANNIYIQGFHRIFVFHETSANTYEYSNTINLNSTYWKSIKYFDNKLLLIDFNNPICKIGLFDFNKQKFTSKINIDYSLPALSHIGDDSYFTCSENNIAVVDAINYKISIYNKKLKIINSFSKNDSTWDRLHDTIIEEFNNQEPGIDAVQLLMKYEQKFCRVSKIYFAGNNYLFVFYLINRENLPFEEHYFHVDIWKYSNTENTFILIKENLTNKHLNNNKIVTIDNYPLLFRFYETGKPTFTNKYLIIPKYESADSPFGITYEKFKKNRDDYVLENDPIVKLYFYKLNIK